MNQFFFDVSYKDRVHYDYRGRQLSQHEQARELAELIAIDVSCMDDENDMGLEVQVRNVGGKLMFAVPVPQSQPVQQPMLMAA
jgi:hypothetical protein